jgi:hypothetical protein
LSPAGIFEDQLESFMDAGIVTHGEDERARTRR